MATTLNEELNSNMRVFQDREEAIAWVSSEGANPSQAACFSASAPVQCGKGFHTRWRSRIAISATPIDTDAAPSDLNHLSFPKGSM